MIIDELVGFSNLYGSNEELVLAGGRHLPRVMSVGLPSSPGAGTKSGFVSATLRSINAF